MRGYSNWDYRPYTPVNKRKVGPNICRLAPSENSCEIECLGKDDRLTLFYTIRNLSDWKNVSAKVEIQKKQQYLFLLNRLAPDTEYECYVEDGEKRRSALRLFRTGKQVGRVINYLHPEDEAYGFSGKYLCSPCIIRLPDETLLASMDVFAGNAPQNLTLLFQSVDDGENWNYVTDIFPCFWGKMFWHQGKLFMLGVSREYGDLLIGFSDDKGKTWSEPSVLLRGSCFSQSDGNHRAPTVVLKSHGRLWTGTEYGSWSNGKFFSSLLSIDEKDNPMIPENWCFTEWSDTKKCILHGSTDLPGGIEGNAVELPDGTVANLLRYNANQAILMRADPEYPEKELVFQQIVDAPFAHTKFEIIRNSDGTYYGCGNPAPGRNVLALFKSDDCLNWEYMTDIINHAECDIEEVGFQYPSICISKDTLYVLSRTAWNHAHNYHDSNCITFHKVLLKNYKRD